MKRRGLPDSGLSLTDGDIKAPGLYSDMLYQPFLCGSVELRDEWLSVESVPRVDASALTVEDFKQLYEVCATSAASN